MNPSKEMEIEEQYYDDARNLRKLLNLVLNIYLLILVYILKSY